MDIFVSVGTGLNPQQEAFVSEVEQRLRAVGLSPRTIGRNTFSADAPLKAVTTLMDQCSGAVVIALERFFFADGVERRDSNKAKALVNARFPTAWNQIEAALAYARELPLLVIVDAQLRCDGLLEKGNDWFVQEVTLDAEVLGSPAFIGVLESWRDRLGKSARERAKKSKVAPVDAANMSVLALVGTLKPGQLWAVIIAAAGALASAFALGVKLGS